MASWSIDVGDEPMRTSATSPRRDVAAVGQVEQQVATSLTLRRTSGRPQTCTSKIFCSSKSAPTWMPDTSVVAARRTSPGLIPAAWALGRSTSISMVGSVTMRWTRTSRAPSIPESTWPTSAAFSCRTSRSCP